MMKKALLVLMCLLSALPVMAGESGYSLTIGFSGGYKPDAGI